MLRLYSNNQIVLLYYYDNKKQLAIVSSSCHLKRNCEPFTFNFDLYESLYIIIISD